MQRFGICCAPRCQRTFEIAPEVDNLVDCPHCTAPNSTTKAMRRYANSSPVALAPAADAPASVNPKAAQGAKKHCLRLLPLPAAVAVNHALEDGVGKYGAANWRDSGVAATVYIDAAKRHIDQWFDGGQELAGDSGVHNLGHAMACLAIIIDAQWNSTLHDDRPTPCRDTDLLLLRSKP